MKQKGHQYMLVIQEPNPSASSALAFINKLQEKHSIEVEKLKNSAAFEQLKRAVENLKINALVEINPGTQSTPGTHLRVTGYSSFEFNALSQSLKDWGSR